MVIEDWILQALERIDGVGMGDDPLEGLSDVEVRRLEAEELIRVEVVQRRVYELGNDEPLVQSEHTVSITAKGRRLVEDS